MFLSFFFFLTFAKNFPWRFTRKVFPGLFPLSAALVWLSISYYCQFI